MTAPLDLSAPVNLVTIRIPGMQGPLGDPGPVNVLSIGTVATTAAGTSATATITGTAPTQVLNLTVPKGDKGDTGNTGPANSLAVGTVTTGAAGSSASATVTGTTPNQTLNFTIPRGDTGLTGPANTLAVGTVTTGAAGSSASATITGTAPNQTLNLTIPKGDKGDTGSAALMTIGTVTTGAAGSNASATITGTAPNYVLNLTVPRGDTGAVNAHTHPVADLTATGTRDGTTFLRGDNTWAVVPLNGAPAQHTHTASDISDSTVTGRSLITAVDAAAARTAIGAGTSNLAIGTTASTAAAGNHTHTATGISDSTAVGRSVMTAVDAAAARTAIGAGTSSLVIGTTGTTAKAGDYIPPDATTGAKGLLQLANHLGGTAAAPTVRSASETQTGIVELATAAETTTGTDNTRAVHPQGLKVELDKKANSADHTLTPYIIRYDGATVINRPNTTRPVHWVVPVSFSLPLTGTTAGGTKAAVNNLDLVSRY